MSDPSSKSDKRDDEIQADLDAAARRLPHLGVPRSLRLGATEEGVEFELDGKVYLFDADTADAMSAALRRCALEVRNGGALS